MGMDGGIQLTKIAINTALAFTAKFTKLQRDFHYLGEFNVPEKKAS